VVKVAGDPSLWQHNGLRCLKANHVIGRVKPISNWLCRAVEVTTSVSIRWIRLITCIRIIVFWVLVSSLLVITCLANVCIFGYKIVCNYMINHFSTLACPFCLFVCSKCDFLLLWWSSIYKMSIINNYKYFILKKKENLK